MARMHTSRAVSKKTVESLKHDEAKRKNIPTAEHQSVLKQGEVSPIRVAYERRNRDLDPQLVWRDAAAAAAPASYGRGHRQTRGIETRRFRGSGALTFMALISRACRSNENGGAFLRANVVPFEVTAFANAGFDQMILENLKTAGVQQAHKEDKITFTALTAWPGELVCALGVDEDDELIDPLKKKGGDYGDSAAGPAKPDGKLKRRSDVGQQPQRRPVGPSGSRCRPRSCRRGPRARESMDKEEEREVTMLGITGPGAGRRGA